MKKVRIIILLTALIFSAGLYAGSGAEGSPVVLKNEKSEYRLGLHLFILEDASKSLSIDEIMSGRLDDRFAQSTESAPNPGFLNAVIWVKFTVVNPHGETGYLYLEHKFPPMDIIELYYPLEGGYSVKRSGDSLPYEERDVVHRNPVFSLECAPKSESVFYMRFESSSSMNLDMSLWSHDSFVEHINTEQYYLGAYYGIMFVMVIYNFFVFLAIREKTYLFYVAFIGCYTVFQLSLNGLGYKFFESDILFWFNNNIPLFMAVTTAFGLLFTRYFLHSAVTTPGFDRYMKGLLYVNTAGVFFTLFADYYISIQVTTFLVMVTIISMTINGFICLFKGYRAARFYVLGWMTFLVGGVLQTLKAFGFVDVNFFTVWSQQIGSAMEVTLLSLALADRINIIEAERSETRETLLHIQKDYSGALEKTVLEKTAELQTERNMLKLKNEQMQNDIALAKKIQMQIIPSGEPASYVASFYKPMDEMGGDYYDFIKFEGSDKIGIFLSDVTGHGVPAAFITSMIKTIILQADDRKHDPAELIKHINDLLTHHTAGNFVTIFYCIYDPADRSLLFSNAGHNPPYVISAESISHLEGSSCVPVGIMSCEDLRAYGKVYMNSEAVLKSGSKLLLYTDGLTEARRFDNPSMFFEHTDFKNIVEQNRILGCSLFIKELFAGLSRFKNGEPLEDDVCMICVDIN